MEAARAPLMSRVLGWLLRSPVSRVVDSTLVASAADPHGTAVAEVIHDMAPGADLLLACVDTVAALARGLCVSLHHVESEVGGSRCLDRTCLPQFNSLTVEILRLPVA